jgi:hypothetical protein
MRGKAEEERVSRGGEGRGEGKQRRRESKGEATGGALPR